MLSFAIKSEDGNRGPIILVMIIEQENMVRMVEGDPFDLKLSAMANAGAPILKYRKITDLDIVIAYEDHEGVKKIKELIAKNDLVGIMKYVERARTIYAGEPGDPKSIGKVK